MATASATGRGATRRRDADYYDFRRTIPRMVRTIATTTISMPAHIAMGPGR